MTPERAKELLPVIQAFAAGKRIQFQPANMPFSWVDARPDILNFEIGDFNWRVKPATIKYRRYIQKLGGVAGVFTWNPARSVLSWVEIENAPNFVRWIDTELQEVEI